MWYVIQVMTGKEAAVMALIEERLDPSLYERCFLIRRERIWRRDGRHILHLETMFPGYLFLSTETPGKVYGKLKEIPQFTKVLKLEEEQFLAVAEDEQEFLRNMLNGDPDDIVRLSKVTLDEKKKIIAAEGPLQKYLERIVKQRLRLRYVMIKTSLFGKERTVLAGIRLAEDDGQEESREETETGEEREA